MIWSRPDADPESALSKPTGLRRGVPRRPAQQGVVCRDHDATYRRGSGRRRGVLQGPPEQDAAAQRGPVLAASAASATCASRRGRRVLPEERDKQSFILKALSGQVQARKRRHPRLPVHLRVTFRTGGSLDNRDGELKRSRSAARSCAVRTRCPAWTAKWSSMSCCRGRGADSALGSRRVPAWQWRGSALYLSRWRRFASDSRADPSLEGKLVPIHKPTAGPARWSSVLTSRDAQVGATPLGSPRYGFSTGTS